VTIQPPQVPVVNNIDVATPGAPDAIRDALYRQAFGPVRWVEVTQALRARGLLHVLECGPGKVLSGLVKRVDGDIQTMTVFDPATLRLAQEMLQ
jgi:[acyl-carrier-protein] S-malonyltransferase